MTIYTDNNFVATIHDLIINEDGELIVEEGLGNSLSEKAEELSNELEVCLKQLLRIQDAMDRFRSQTSFYLSAREQFQHDVEQGENNRWSKDQFYEEYLKLQNLL